MKKIEVGHAAKIVLLDNSTVVSGTISYSSSNVGVATVNNAGVIQGVSAGQTMITATNSANGRKAAVMIEIIGASLPTTAYNVRLDDYVVIPVPTTFTGLTNGAYTGALVVGTAANTRFYNPQAVSVDPTTGLIYVAELQGKAIVELNPADGSTRICVNLSSNQDGANGLVAPGNGKVYYSSFDGGLSVCSAVISTGVATEIKNLGYGGNLGAGMAYRNGVVYLIQYANRIVAIDTNNSNAMTTILTDSNLGPCLAIYGTNLYYTGVGGISFIPVTGGSATVVANGSYGGTQGLCADADGILYIGKSSSNLITAFNIANSSFSTVYTGSAIANMRNIAITSSKKLVTVNVNSGSTTEIKLSN